MITLVYLWTWPLTEGVTEYLLSGYFRVHRSTTKAAVLPLVHFYLIVHWEEGSMLCMTIWIRTKLWSHCDSPDHLLRKDFNSYFPGPMFRVSDCVYIRTSYWWTTIPASQWPHTHLHCLVSFSSEQVVGPPLTHTARQQLINGARVLVRARPKLTALMTAPSRNNSAHSESSDDYVSLNGNSQIGGSAMTVYTAVPNYNWRRFSLPPTQLSCSGSQPGNKHASGNGSLQGIPEREDSVSCSHQLVCSSLLWCNGQSACMQEIVVIVCAHRYVCIMYNLQTHDYIVSIYMYNFLYFFSSCVQHTSEMWQSSAASWRARAPAAASHSWGAHSHRRYGTVVIKPLKVMLIWTNIK